MMLLKQSFLTRSRPQQGFSESRITDSVKAAEGFISQWVIPHLSDSSSSSCSLSTLFSEENRAEGRKFLDVLGKLQHAIQKVVVANPESSKLPQAKDLMKTAMKYLEKEFLRILTSNRCYLDPESVSNWSSDSNTTPRSSGTPSNSESDGDGENDSVSSSESSTERRRRGGDADAIIDLKMIANCMIASGYGKDCAKIYKKLRKKIIIDALHHLGFEKLTYSRTQKLEWNILENKIKQWERLARKSITIVFNGERILSDHIFSSSVSIAESTFAEITLQSALKLFIFPIAIAKSKKTTEKIFPTLDVYQTILHLIPQIEEIFSSDSTAFLRSQANESLEKLSESVNAMMTEFQTSIVKESSKTPLHGGGIHQLTRYVMNFIVFLSDYTDSLVTILKESPLPLPEDYLSSGGGNNAENPGSFHTPMTARLAWLILVLLCKIDAKSRLYNDVALSYLFLANNLHYVLIKVRSSNLREVLGDDWVTNHEVKVKKYLEKYEKKSWKDVITSLPGDSTATEKTEESLRRFNEAFEEVYKKHRNWVVPDPQLREEIKDFVTKKIVPGYMGFYEKYPVGSCENVRFTPEDLSNCISDLYLSRSVPDSPTTSLPDPVMGALDRYAKALFTNRQVLLDLAPIVGMTVIWYIECTARNKKELARNREIRAMIDAQRAKEEGFFRLK